jgi:hypothetical protein
VQAARVEYAAAQRQQVEAEARHAALEAELEAELLLGAEAREDTWGRECLTEQLVQARAEMEATAEAAAASAEAVAERDLAFKQVHPHGGVSLCRTWSTTRSTSSSSSGSSASRTA